MTSQIERTLDELYAGDPERADAVVFGRRSGVNRRGFLNGAGLAGVGAAVGASIPFGANMPVGLVPAAFAQGAQAPATAATQPAGPQPLDFPGKERGLSVLGEKPLVAETPEHLLDDETTPTNKFFIRNNGQIPEPTANADAWKLIVDGEVNNKLELTLAELKSRFQPRTYRMVLECGGNGRSFFQPQARGNQWTNGGAGCAEWTGIPLAEILKAAGVKDTASTPPITAPIRICPATPEGVPLPRHADPQGDGPAQPDRLRDERRAAAEHPRRAGAPRHPGLAGFALA